MKQRGFTLIEVVLVIVITGVIATIGARMLKTAFDGYFDLSKRVNTLGNADIALHNLRQDIQSALPNSIRIGCNNRCLELLHTRDSGRYRAALSVAATEDILDFASADTSFDLASTLDQTGSTVAHSVVTGNNASDCQNSNADCLVINHAFGGAQDAYQGNRATITALDAAINPTSMDIISTQFAAASSRQRYYIVDTPITYLCDLTTGTLTRYHDYSIAANQTSVDTDAELRNQANPAIASLVSNHLSSCRFSFQGGGNSHGGIASIELNYQYQDPTVNQGELQTFAIFSQVAVDQKP